MTIFSTNSIFQPVQKYIKYHNAEIDVISGANKVNSLSLCSVKVDYEQYQVLSVQVPKDQVDYMLSFPMLGIKTTFITIKPIYSGTDATLNYLKWKFQPSSDAKWSFTKVLTFTGTSSNPIPPILIDNPNPDCPVQLEIIVSAMANDYLLDAAAFLYLDGLAYDDVHTFNETNSGILAFFNKDGVLAGTLDVSDIVNVSKVPGQNRIIIDESSENNIVLDFLTEFDALQALSAINYLLLDPLTRILPAATDTTPPVITYEPAVNLLTATIDINLSLYTLTTFTKSDFITAAIDTVIDSRDGVIAVTASNIVFNQFGTFMNTIVAPGTYTATITVADIAGNTTTEIITIEAYAIIIDVTPPVINYTADVTGTIVSDIDMTDYPVGFYANDARILCLMSVTDDVDGMIPLSAVSVVFEDSLSVVIPAITVPGSYTITFSVQDAALNTFTETLDIQAIP